MLCHSERMALQRVLVPAVRHVLTVHHCGIIVYYESTGIGDLRHPINTDGAKHFLDISCMAALHCQCMPACANLVSALQMSSTTQAL